MTNILIPTDFTETSLQLADQALAAVDVKQVNIILFHAFEQPSSEFDLLNPFRQRPYSDLVTENLRHACKQFKDRHGDRVQKIYFRFLEGNSIPLFRNFIDANEIDVIYCPDSYVPVKASRLSVDPRRLFQKSSTPVIRMEARKEYDYTAHTSTIHLGNAATIQVSGI